MSTLSDTYFPPIVDVRNSSSGKQPHLSEEIPKNPIREQPLFQSVFLKVNSFQQWVVLGLKLLDWFRYLDTNNQLLAVSLECAGKPYRNRLVIAVATSSPPWKLSRT
jgi:hypothetical protein